MLTRALVLVAALASASAASASAPPAPDVDPTLINHPVAYTQVAEWRPQSAPALSGVSRAAPVWSEPQHDRRVPGNAGDGSYGGDWAETWGGP
jgi:hypothetical protein